MYNNKEQLKADLLETINRNPQLIEKLSIERLQKLSILYDEIIKKNNAKIFKNK